MLDDRSSHEVMTSLMGLVDCGEHEHHIIEELCLDRPGTNISDTLGDGFIDSLTSVPIDQSDPLINNKSFRPELKVDGLKHLNASVYIV